VLKYLNWRWGVCAHGAFYWPAERPPLRRRIRSLMPGARLRHATARQAVRQEILPALFTTEYLVAPCEGQAYTRSGSSPCSEKQHHHGNTIPGKCATSVDAASTDAAYTGADSANAASTSAR